MPKSHFVIIPSKIVRRNKPERLQLYCDLYLLEVSHTRYSIADLARDRGVTYAVAYNLLKEVRDSLNRARNRRPQREDKPLPVPLKTSLQETYKNNIKNIPDNPRNTGVPQLRLIKSIQNTDKERPSLPRPTGIPEALKEELELLTTNCEEKLLSKDQLNMLSPRERMIYIDIHGSALKSAGII